MAVDMPLTMRLLRGDAEMATVLADAPPTLIAESMSDRYALLGGLISDAIHPAKLENSQLRARVDRFAGLPYFASHLASPHARGELSHHDYAALLADILIAGLVGTSSTLRKTTR